MRIEVQLTAVVVLVWVSVVGVALFGDKERSRRAFRLLRMMMRQR
jgi:hypothetical protein